MEDGDSDERLPAGGLKLLQSIAQSTCIWCKILSSSSGHSGDEIFLVGVISGPGLTYLLCLDSMFVFFTVMNVWLSGLYVTEFSLSVRSVGKLTLGFCCVLLLPVDLYNRA